MKQLAAIGLMMFAGVTQAADWDHGLNIQAGVKQFLAAYKNGGMSGAVSLVDGCYQSAQKLPRKSDQKLKKLELCISADLAAYRFDDAMAAQNGFPPNEFFVLDKVSKRVDRITEWFPDPEQRAQVIGGLNKSAIEQLNKLAQ